jgi:hypothetical protein
MHNIIPFVKYLAQKIEILILATKARSHEGKEEKWRNEKRDRTRKLVWPLFPPKKRLYHCSHMHQSMP